VDDLDDEGACCLVVFHGSNIPNSVATLHSPQTICKRARMPLERPHLEPRGNLIRLEKSLPRAS
jgi:hypothetical protein